MTATTESAAVAALLECGGEIPPSLSRLQANAPESFSDPRHGQAAAVIRGLRADGLPVHARSVAERLTFADAAAYVAAVVADALPLELAEAEAGLLWDAFEVRKVKSTLAESLTALESSPGKVKSIAAGIIRTIEDLDAEHSEGGLTVRTPDDLLAMKFDDSDRILGDRLLAKGQSLVIAGAGSIGKSRLLLQLAVATITGRQFIGFETRGEDLRWLVLQAENSNRRLQSDLAALQRWAGRDWCKVNERLLLHTLETDADGFLSLSSPRTQERIRRTITGAKADVVVFDSLYNFGAGDLNTDEGMSETLLAVSRLTKEGNALRCPVVLHHALTGRAGAAKATGYDRASFGRNSKVLHSWTRGQINLAPGSSDANDLLVLSCGKCSNGQEFAPFAIRLDPETMLYAVEPDFDVEAWTAEVTGKAARSGMNVDRVRELCAGTLTKSTLAKQVQEDCGCGRTAAFNWVNRAHKAGRIHWTKATETYVAKP